MTEVQSMLGHAIGAMTLDPCSHLFDDALDAVADRLGEARSGLFCLLVPQDVVTPLVRRPASV